jgi:hypothetical protein
MELNVLKPRLRGRTTRNGKILWSCKIKQRIGEMEVVVASSGEHYTPKRAWTRAVRALSDHSGYVEAVRRIVGP